MITKKQPEQLTGSYRTIPIGHRQFAIIDAEDYDRVACHLWRLYRSSRCWYVARKVYQNGKCSLVKLHRFILNALPGFEVHHVNHNPRDCRKTNLEQLTPAEHRARHNKS